MLINLKLQNFKKHESLDVDFTAGTNGIYGPNYKGKTTLLYAILFALGGSSHVPGNRLVKLGSSGKFEVALTFQIGAHAYRVVRGKTSANLYDGEALIATSASAVTAEIERLIGMTIKQWKELHYAKQKNAHSLLRYSASNLHQLLRRLVGAEELDQIQTRLKSMATREIGIVEAMAEHSQPITDLEREAAEVDKEREAAGERLAGKESALSLAVLDRDMAQTQVDEATSKLQGIREDREKAALHAQRLEAAQRGTAAAKAAYDERQAALHASAEEKDKFGDFDPIAVRSLIGDVERAVAERKAAFDAVDEARDRCKDADYRVEVLELEVARLTKVEASGSSLEQAEAELARHLEAVSAQRAKVNALKTAVDGAECPTCKRPMEDHDPEALRKELDLEFGRLEGLESDTGGYRMVAHERSETRRQLETSKAKLADANEAARKADEAFDRADARFQKAGLETDRLASMVGDLAQMRQSVTDFERAFALWEAAAVESERAVKAYQAALEAERRLEGVQVAGLEAADALIEGWAERLKGLREQRDVAAARMNAMREDLALLRGQTAGLEQRQQLLAKQLERAREVEAKLGAAQKRLAKIQHLQKYLKENGEQYMNKAWAGFLAQASRFASLCTGGDIEGLERTDDGSFTYLEAGEQMQLEEASGAQEAIIGLAVQMALASSAPCHLNVLLLDEPTADMDADCSLASIAAFSSLGQQVVFVSHHQTDNALCQNAITL